MKCKNCFCRFYNKKYNCSIADAEFENCERKKQFDKYYSSLSEHERKVLKKFKELS